MTRARDCRVVGVAATSRAAANAARLDERRNYGSELDVLLACSGGAEAAWCGPAEHGTLLLARGAAEVSSRDRAAIGSRPPSNGRGVEVGGCYARRATARCACKPSRIPPPASTSAGPATARKQGRGRAGQAAGPAAAPDMPTFGDEQGGLGQSGGALPSRSREYLIGRSTVAAFVREQQWLRAATGPGSWPLSVGSGSAERVLRAVTGTWLRVCWPVDLKQIAEPSWFRSRA